MSAINFNNSPSLQGIQQAQRMLNKSAQQIAANEGDLAQETVNQIVASDSLSANVEVTKTKDEMLQELMNM